jgi:hypothetical protein
MADRMGDHSGELDRLIADARQARPDAAAEARIAAGVKGAVGAAALPASPGGRSVLAGAAKLTIVAVALGGALWWGLRPAPTADLPVSMPTVPVPAPVVKRPPPTVVVETAPPPPVASAPRAPVVARPAPRRASANANANAADARAIAPPAEARASEWQLVRQAREALGADPSASLRLTAEHARLYPRGALTQEREVIAVDALVRLGRRQEAEARAGALLRQSPQTAHRAHIEALLARPAP